MTQTHSQRQNVARLRQMENAIVAQAYQRRIGVDEPRSIRTYMFEIKGGKVSARLMPSEAPAPFHRARAASRDAAGILPLAGNWCIFVRETGLTAPAPVTRASGARCHHS